MNSKLLELESGRLRGLIIACPPRHGKSFLGSIHFPAWYLMRNPDKRVILVTYSDEFARRFGNGARRIIRQWGPALFGVGLARDTYAANRFDIEGHDGGLDAVGLGGSLTGKGGHLIILDDVVKNGEEANSKTIRDKLWDDWQSTIENRAEPGCVWLIINTRWNEEDLSGRLIRQVEQGLRPGWEVLRLPCLADHDPVLGETDVLGRQPGEALWPERYSAQHWQEYKNRADHDDARQGPYWWDALYQGRPSPREGGNFKRSWFRYCQEDPEHYTLETDGGPQGVRKSDCPRFFTVDLAVSEKTSADYFALGVWAVTPKRHLVLEDVVHERIQGPDQGPLIQRLRAQKRPVFIGIEAVAYQLSLIQDLRRKGLPIKELRVDRDKVARAQLAAVLMSAGSIHFRAGAPWLRAVEDELLLFPNARHDDLVDMISMGAHELSAFTIPTVN